MAFRIGQKVVCVNDSPLGIERGSVRLGGLTKGRKYTVRWIGYYSGSAGEGTHIRVEEIIRPCCGDISNTDTPFIAFRFRPLVERKTDTGMAILKKIAADASKKRERADAE